MVINVKAQKKIVPTVVDVYLTKNENDIIST